MTHTQRRLYRLCRVAPPSWSVRHPLLAGALLALVVGGYIVLMLDVVRPWLYE
jgi:hypothetical protein